MYTQLNAKAMGLTLGIVTFFSMVLCGLLALFFDIGTTWVNLVGEYYIGYSATLTGSLIGGVWGFFDGLIGGFIVCWLYNKISQKCTSSES